MNENYTYNNIIKLKSKSLWSELRYNMEDSILKILKVII